MEWRVRFVDRLAGALSLILKLEGSSVRRGKRIYCFRAGLVLGFLLSVVLWIIWALVHLTKRREVVEVTRGVVPTSVSYILTLRGSPKFLEYHWWWTDRELWVSAH